MRQDNNRSLMQASLTGIGFIVLMGIWCYVPPASVQNKGVCGSVAQLSPPEGVIIGEVAQREPMEKWRITGYCKESCCCGDCADGVTASGKPATGMIIAAPPEIPFGTELYIEGWGWGEVQDRGGAIKGNRLDLLFEDKDGVSGHQRALNWGVQYREIEI